MTLQEVSEQGSRLATLEAFRDELARSIDVCDSARDKAQMGRLLVDVLEQIDDIGGGQVETPRKTGLSDFEKRLREREQRATAPRRTKGT